MQKIRFAVSRSLVGRNDVAFFTRVSSSYAYLLETKIEAAIVRFQPTSHPCRSRNPLLDIIEHRNTWRRGAGKPFRFFGPMEKTVSFDGPDIIPLHQIFGRMNAIFEYSTVLVSRRTIQGGRDAQSLVNHSDHEQMVYLKTDRSCTVLHDPSSAEAEKIISLDGIRVPALKMIPEELGSE